MSPLKDASMANLSINDASSPSSPPSTSASSKSMVAGSDGKTKLDGVHQPLEKAMNLIIDVETLTKLCKLEGADAVKIRDTLVKDYTDICNQQAIRITDRESLVNTLHDTMKQEITLDKKVATHYDDFVSKMGNAATLIGWQRNQALRSAARSIKSARADSQRARNLRKEVENTKAKLRLIEREMVAAQDRLVDLLYSTVLYCVNVGCVNDLAG